LEELRQNSQKKLRVLEQQLESEHEERLNFVHVRNDLGPILQNSVSAENLSDRFSSSNFGQIFTLKFRTNFHPQISDKFSPSNFGQIFSLKFRTNFHQQRHI
jgi:hypothetical protein